LRARKRFGQHFLEPAWVTKLVDALDARPDETFVEIGPGRGALTVPLAGRVKRLVAVEIDRDLARALTARAPANLTIVEGDVLEVGESSLGDALGDGPVRVAGNLPYNVASPILFRLVDLAPRLHFADATVMLQREVADRLTAAPGGRDYGVLSILVGHHARVEPVLLLPPGAFRPPPNVRSAVVRLVFHPADPPVKDETLFGRIVQAAFTRRRKTLANALLAADATVDVVMRALAGAGVDGRRRPETLTIAEWAAIANAFPN